MSQPPSPPPLSIRQPATTMRDVPREEVKFGGSDFFARLLAKFDTAKAAGEDTPYVSFEDQIRALEALERRLGESERKVADLEQRIVALEPKLP